MGKFCDLETPLLSFGERTWGRASASVQLEDDRVARARLQARLLGDVWADLCHLGRLVVANPLGPRVFSYISGSTFEILAIVPKSEAEAWLRQFEDPV